MGRNENATLNARVQRNLGLDFYNETAQIIAKTSNSLQLSVSDMVTHVNFPTFAMADPRHGGLVRNGLAEYARLDNVGRKCKLLSH